MKSLLLGMALLVSSSLSAFAVPVTFSFSGGSGQQAPSFTFTKSVTPVVPGGSSTLSLTVRSNVSNNSGTTLTANGNVGRWSQGLGIIDSEAGDEHYVDGFGRNDVLSFAFSQTVKLISVGFSYVDSNDDFALFFDKAHDGVLANDLVWGSRDIPGSSTTGTYSFLTLNGTSGVDPMSYIGRLFGIGAFGDNDEFKVVSISVELVKPSVVPLPGALPLLLAGLGGLGAMRVRRRKKAA